MVEIIAIDGPASVGKSTLAKMLSDYYVSPLLHSGRLYRYVALQIKLNNTKLDERQKIIKYAKAITRTNLLSKELFSSEIDNIASKISTKEYLRTQLTKYQRDFPTKYAKANKYAIVEGRDIGTKIFPNAKFKFFMWADAKIRAKRRFQQITKKATKTGLKQIYEEIRVRDLRDLNRKIAPLKPAINSVLLDTSYLDIEQVFNAVKNNLNN